ncbi:hypothetical protein NPX13_g6972 [Xylaria arbuscula]|uniref:O-methyltransferase C-terminal domain-containing protein n=1 Tax=Xylaria arbuscula TaxID=114810 RepID=A0A9W8TKW7_9PEZI|nr:hypothetical protein NPX13_g6972 [Xylaria arbuscula]
MDQPTVSYNTTLPMFSKMPLYLVQHDYRTPLDPTNSVFQFAKGYRGSLFHYYSEHPVEGASFDCAMSSARLSPEGWVNVFPSEILLKTDQGGDTPLIVDVGGSVGHDIEKVRAKHPDTVDRLYLEDLPSVISRSNCDERINKINYDFFKPQPVRGARAYYMHSILHDWPDDAARKILEMQRDAMQVGYSTLLINDHIIADHMAHPQATGLDLTVMGLAAGRERKEEDWRKLLASAGFTIVKIWTSTLGSQGIIEAERKT